MNTVKGWVLGDFDGQTPLWWEIIADDADNADNGDNGDRPAPGYILLSPVGLLTLMDVHLSAGFKVTYEGMKSWMPCKPYYFVGAKDSSAGITYRLMNPGEHERLHSALAAGPARAERQQTAAIAVNRDRTSATLSALAAEITAMKQRAGVMA